LGHEENEILIIEDDAALRSALGDLLGAEGYSVAMAKNRCEGFKMAAGHAFDLILLDLMLPDNNGLSVYRDIRKAGIATPILALSARTQTSDKLLGVGLDADDYVTKPFGTAELLERIEALLRGARVRSLQSSERVGAIKVDVRHTRVTRDGKSVSMTAHEFRLLHYLVKRPGRCVSRGELLKTVWGYAGNSTTRTIDMHIASLRKKLESNPKFPKLILTIPKVGYMFVESSRTYNQRLKPQTTRRRRIPPHVPAAGGGLGLGYSADRL
jgi:DNA-binding response OmpR family regulator